MFERIKYAAVNLVANTLLLALFSLERKIDCRLFFIVMLVVAIADILFVNGEKYGYCAYFYLMFNRFVGFGIALFFCMMTKGDFYWLGFLVYCFEIVTIIFNQWELVSEGILMEQLQSNYECNMYELDTLLSKEQKDTLNSLRSVVDEDKMYLFIATFNPKEIQNLLNVELWGIAFLIQKEDYEKMEKIAQKTSRE